MSKKVGVMNFDAECRKALSDFGIEAHETIDELVPDAADIALKMIKSNSKKRTGAYAKDWAKKKDRAWGYGTSYIIYNRKHYRVAHLLEKDHVFRGPNGKVTASWHGDGVIEDANDYAESWLYDEVAKRFK